MKNHFLRIESEGEKRKANTKNFSFQQMTLPFCSYPRLVVVELREDEYFFLCAHFHFNFSALFIHHLDHSLENNANWHYCLLTEVLGWKVADKTGKAVIGRYLSSFWKLVPIFPTFSNEEQATFPFKLPFIAAFPFFFIAISPNKGVTRFFCSIIMLLPWRGSLESSISERLHSVPGRSSRWLRKKFNQRPCVLKSCWSSTRVHSLSSLPARSL